MPYSRAMSCADFALVPAGGRRRTRSRPGYFNRYVQLDAPPGYCVTSGVPSTAICDFSQRSTAGTSSGSSMLGQLDARDQPLVHLVGPVGDAQRARLGEEGREPLV